MWLSIGCWADFVHGIYSQVRWPLASEASVRLPANSEAEISAGCYCCYSSKASSPLVGSQLLPMYSSRQSSIGTSYQCSLHWMCSILQQLSVCWWYVSTRDLRIVFLRSNRISNRIGRPIRFRIKFSNGIGRIYHAVVYTLQWIFNPFIGLP